jgi:hypothetical protein
MAALPAGPMPGENESVRGDTLNGWKEIAAYIGKSVRSVQRWERELALPVHRIPTAEGGQIVYARRAEIDAWRASLDAPSAADIDPAPSSERDAAGAPGPRALARNRVAAWAAFVAVTIIVAAVIGFRAAPRFVGHPARFEFDGKDLVAITEGGWIVWRHSFDRLVQFPSTSSRRIMTRQVERSEEAIVPVRFAAGSNQMMETDAVYAFRDDGSVIWKVQPTVRLADDTQTFTGPWHVYDVVASPAAGPKRVWIAYSHNTWWPAFVVEVAPDGRQRIVYVQAGRIYSIGLFATPTQTFLAVGGTVNEYRGASLALLGVDDPPSQSVRTAQTGLTCAECPVTATPRAFFVLPRSELSRTIARPSGWISHIDQIGGNLVFSTDEGFLEGAIGVITPTLSVTRYDWSDRYWEMHRTLEEQGRISHMAGDCPERNAPVDIRTWSAAAGWGHATVTPVTSRVQLAAGDHLP